MIWKRPSDGVATPIAPFGADYDFDRVRRGFNEEIVIETSGYIFRPNTFLLGWTIERVQLPHRSRLAARVEGKSSLARLGVRVHVTAPTIHAGFGYKKDDTDYPGSPLQLEIRHVGPLEIKLEEGMRICQIIFETVDGTPEKGYEGRFSIQGPASSLAPKEEAASRRLEKSGGMPLPHSSRRGGMPRLLRPFAARSETRASPV